MDSYYTPQQVAQKLQVTAQTVWRWIRGKEIEAVRIGKGYRISSKVVEDFLNKRKTI